MYGISSYGAYGQLIDYRPLFARNWHSPHYKYSEVLSGTYHLPHSRFPPHDVYKTPWLAHIHPTHLTPGEPEWWH